MKTKATQYTLRDVPPALDKAIRSKALREGKSMNQTTIEALEAGLRLRGDPIVHHDLDFVRNSWVEDPHFDDAIKAQSQIDPKLWE